MEARGSSVSSMGEQSGRMAGMMGKILLYYLCHDFIVDKWMIDDDE